VILLEKSNEWNLSPSKEESSKKKKKRERERKREKEKKGARIEKQKR
jgi:HKD family nuclease